jgi:hypothetical protein
MSEAQHVYPRNFLPRWVDELRFLWDCPAKMKSDAIPVERFTCKTKVGLVGDFPATYKTFL